jgi:diacylglycerol kinase (ATP)
MPRSDWASTGLLIFNSRAGAGRTDLMSVDEVAAQCAQLVSGLRVVLTEYHRHAEELAAKAVGDGTDVVIVAGGDGTTREVASGLVGAASSRPGDRIPVLINIPGGTANSLYREIWSDRPWQRALESAIATAVPRVRWVDMARIEETGTLVLLGTGTGLVAEVLATANRLTGVPGRDRYLRAVAETLRGVTPYPLRVTVDGRVVHDGSTHLTNIGGGRYRAGQFRLMPLSVLDDGLLDICVVGGELDPAELLRLTRDGRHVDRPEVVYTRGSRFSLERTDGRPLTLEYDGEMAAGNTSRCTVAVLPGALPVLAPSAEA